MRVKNYSGPDADAAPPTSDRPTPRATSSSPMRLEPRRRTRTPTRRTRSAPSQWLPNPQTRRAGINPIQGELILFRVKTADLQNRPLELHIDGRARSRTAQRLRRARTSHNGTCSRAGADRAVPPECRRRALALQRGLEHDRGRPARPCRRRRPGRRAARATATRGCLSGANAANQASVSLASFAGARLRRDRRDVGRRLVADRRAQLGRAGLARHLDAGDGRRGAGAARPPPCACSGRSSGRPRARSRARAGVSAPLSSVGRGRRPCSPIAAAISAICSGVASTLPWPIALEPTARSSPISLAGGIVERAAPMSPGSCVEAEALGGRPPAGWRPASRPAARTPSCTSWRTRSRASRRRTRRWRSAAGRPRASPRSGTGSLAALGHVRRQHAGERDDLERGAGRLRGGVGDARPARAPRRRAGGRRRCRRSGRRAR